MTRLTKHERAEIGCDCVIADRTIEEGVSPCGEPVVAVLFGCLRVCQKHDDQIADEADKAIDLEAAREAVIVAARGWVLAGGEAKLRTVVDAVTRLNRLEATDG